MLLTEVRLDVNSTHATILSGNKQTYWKLVFLIDVALNNLAFSFASCDFMMVLIRTDLLIPCVSVLHWQCSSVVYNVPMFSVYESTRIWYLMTNYIYISRMADLYNECTVTLTGMYSDSSISLMYRATNKATWPLNNSATIVWMVSTIWASLYGESEARQ